MAKFRGGKKTPGHIGANRQTQPPTRPGAGPGPVAEVERLSDGSTGVRELVFPRFEAPRGKQDALREVEGFDESLRVAPPDGVIRPG